MQLSLAEWLHPSRFGRIPIIFGRLGVGTSQPHQFLKIQLLGILVHFLAATWKAMTRPCGSLSLGHVTASTPSTPHHPFSICFPPSRWMYSLPHGFTDYHVALSHWSTDWLEKSKIEWQVAAFGVSTSSCWHQYDTCLPLCVWWTLYKY